jgi:signal transduction histidine kinase
MQENLELDARLLEALASLNQVSATINSLAPDNVSDSQKVLQWIVESAIRVIPGASAVIYTFDPIRQAFEPHSRVAAGEIRRHPPRRHPEPEDAPRPDGIGMRAIQQRRRVLSYEEPDLNVHPYYQALGVRVTACFPLIVAQQAVGALYLFLHEERRLNQLELLMLDNFVNQAAMAIYHSRRLSSIHRDLSRKEENLRRLHRAAMLLSSRLRLEETLESILQVALEVTNAHYGIFRLLDKEGKNLVTRAVAGEKLYRPLVEALPLESNSIMAWVARTRQAILIPDLRAEPWSKMYYPLDAGLTMRSEVAVPLINASGRLEGVLNLESPEVGAFNEEDRYLLQTLATYAVAAIQEVRLLDAILEIARRLLTQPCKEVLQHIAQTACDLLNATDAAIWLLEGEELILQATCGSASRAERLPLRESLAGQAILKQSPIVVRDLRREPRFYRQDLARRYGWRRALVVPVAAGEHPRPIGAFSIYSTDSEPGRFAESDWDTKVLSSLAHYAALAVQNEQQQQALRAAQEQRALAEMFAAVGDIASNLLHRLNNKIGTIPVRVQNIQEKYTSLLENDPYLTHNLSEIERCALEAMQTVRENLSHLHPGSPEAATIAQCVAAAARSVPFPAEVSIQTEGLESLPPVMASTASLTFVFTNLFENAIEAMQGAGNIRVRGNAEGQWIEITVTDSGPGIPPELHERIFELNYSGHNGGRSPRLGFGLWWVKTLIHRLGGKIAVESDGQHGTTFRIRLPAGGIP